MAITLSRAQKAMQIERRTSRQWTVAPDGIFRIPSQTVAGRGYNTSLTGCDCPDSIYRVGTPNGPRMCKHVAALHISLGRNAA